MVEILKSFERAATQFRPIVLVLPGLALTGGGLFIWLGGLGFRRLLLTLVGIMAGAFCSVWVVPQNAAAMLLGGVAGAFVAVILERFFSAALLGALAGCFAFVLLAWPAVATQQGTVSAPADATGERQALDVRESLAVVRAYALDATDAVRRAAGGLEASNWAIISATAFVLLVAGLLFRHLGGALSYSTVGATMIFSGIVLLLVFKGSAPITLIQGRAAFSGSVFLGMIAFGTVEQWLLCRRADRKAGAESAAGQSGAKKKKGKKSRRGRSEKR
jgi:hypothetical protein